MSEYYLIMPVVPTTSNRFPNRLRSVRVEFFSSILPIHAPPPDPMPLPLHEDIQLLEEKYSKYVCFLTLYRV